MVKEPSLGETGRGEKATGLGEGTGWPSPLDANALHGLAGDFVRAVEPYSEADSVALLTQLLVGIGNVVGRGLHFKVEDDRHALNLNLVEVGVTSKGRKGTSWGRVKAVLKQIDADSDTYAGGAR
jgi:hypothetical protein